MAFFLIGFSPLKILTHITGALAEKKVGVG